MYNFISIDETIHSSKLVYERIDVNGRIVDMYVKQSP